MNEVATDWLHREDTTRASGTALPSTIIGMDNAELNSLRTRVSLLERENQHLKAENAELRERCMTRLDRIRNASVEKVAALLCSISMDNFNDGLEENYDKDCSEEYWSNWLQEIGEI